MRCSSRPARHPGKCEPTSQHLLRERSERYIFASGKPSRLHQPNRRHGVSDMNRRLFVCGSLSTFATVLDANGKTEAAPATPVATPEPTPLTPLTGMQADVFRADQLAGSGISTMIAGQPDW